MKNKGFTLIELLAVIVILAVIALITVPQILKLITDAKEKSARDSMYGYVKAIEQSYIKNTIDPDVTEHYKGKYSEISTLTIAQSQAEGGLSLELDLKGAKPNLEAASSDYVLLDKYGEVKEALIKFEKYYVSYCDGDVSSIHKDKFEAC